MSDNSRVSAAVGRRETAACSPASACYAVASTESEDGVAVVVGVVVAVVVVVVVVVAPAAACDLVAFWQNGSLSRQQGTLYVRVVYHLYYVTLLSHQ